MAYLRVEGEVFEYRLHHMSVMSSPYASDTRPLDPMTFLVLISYLYSSRRKYFRSGPVLDKHCKAEFMKHVLPRLDRPQTPSLPSDGTILLSAICMYSIDGGFQRALLISSLSVWMELLLCSGLFSQNTNLAFW